MKMRNKTGRKKGFTLVEIIFAASFMAIGILAMLFLNSAAGSSSMDAYYEFLAFSLAREPIEIYRAMGYNVVSAIASGISPSLPNFPVNDGLGQIGGDNPDVGMFEIQYPSESQHFMRRIDMTNVSNNGINGVRVTVTVAAVGQSRVAVWMQQDSVTLSTLILEQPQ